jgi:hypothetical protein
MYTWPQRRCSAENLLAAEDGAVKTRRKSGEEPMESVSIRLPSEQVRLFELKADEAFMKRGTYIALRLLSDEPEPWPALAALARVIAIHEAVLTGGAVTGEQLRELRSLIQDFARIARSEASL